MKLSMRRGNRSGMSPQADTIDQVDLDDDAKDQVDPDDLDLANTQWTGAAGLSTKAVSIGLLSALAAGPLALVLVIGSSSTPAPLTQAAAVAVVDEGERAAVSAFAVDFVATWLSSAAGQEDQLDRFITDTSSISLPDVAPRVAGVVVSDLAQAASPEGSWTATVSAVVTPARTPGEPPRPGVRRYFQVPLSYGRDALTDQPTVVAVTLPAPIAAPAAGETLDLGYRYRVSLEDPAVLAANAFLTALLTGAGDVARYISPGTTIAAIDPAPYSTFDLDDVDAATDRAGQDEAAPTNGEQLRLLLSGATGTSSSDQISVQYALTMTARDGRWEVSALDPTPLTLTESTTPETGSETDPASPDPTETTDSSPSSTTTNPTTSSTN